GDAALAVPLREHLLPGHVGFVDECEARHGRHACGVAALRARGQGRAMARHSAGPRAPASGGEGAPWAVARRPGGGRVGQPPGRGRGELWNEVKQRVGGALPGWASRLAAVPWVVRASARIVQKRIAYMPMPLWDLIGFVVSQDNSCRYCYGITRALLKIAGYR